MRILERIRTSKGLKKDISRSLNRVLDIIEKIIEQLNNLKNTKINKEISVHETKLIEDIIKNPLKDNEYSSLLNLLKKTAKTH